MGSVSDERIMEEFASMPFRPTSYGSVSAVSRALGAGHAVVRKVLEADPKGIMEMWYRKRGNRDNITVGGKVYGYYELVEHIEGMVSPRREPKPPVEHYLEPDQVEEQRRREKEMLEKALETVTKLMEPTYTN